MKKNKIYAVLNEDRGGDTSVTIHRSYKSARKKFDKIVEEIKEILVQDGGDAEDLNYFNLTENHLAYDLDEYASWGNIRIIAEGEDS